MSEWVRVDRYFGWPCITIHIMARSEEGKQIIRLLRANDKEPSMDKVGILIESIISKARPELSGCIVFQTSLGRYPGDLKLQICHTSLPRLAPHESDKEIWLDKCPVCMGDIEHKSQMFQATEPAPANNPSANRRVYLVCSEVCGNILSSTHTSGG